MAADANECCQALLRLDSSLLLYDIGNYAYIAGHRQAIGTGDDARAHLITDICAEGNIDRIARVLDMAYSAVIEALQPYAQAVDTRAGDIVNVAGLPQEYVIMLVGGRRLSTDRLQHIGRLAHEYMTMQAVYDWLTLTADAPTAAAYADKAADAAVRLRAAVGHVPTLRRLSAF